jgi:hypothetical protein
VAADPVAAGLVDADVLAGGAEAAAGVFVEDAAGADCFAAADCLAAGLMMAVGNTEETLLICMMLDLDAPDLLARVLSAATRRC